MSEILPTIKTTWQMTLASLIVAFFALIISGFTAWLTLLKRATVKMTQPTTVYFGPDYGCKDGPPKVFLRTLLYASAARGCIVESMFLKLWCPDGTPVFFNVWVYGEERLARGSGLYIPATGVTTNHHFLLPVVNDFAFSPGRYVLELYAAVVGEKSTKMLNSIQLPLSNEDAQALSAANFGIYFDWSPDTDAYRSHIQLSINDPREFKCHFNIRTLNEDL